MLFANMGARSIPLGSHVLIRYGLRRVKARRPCSATRGVCILGYGIAMRMPIVRVAGRAKQYVTGETGGRLHSATTDTMWEGKR